jgi:hypothetical protein
MTNRLLRAIETINEIKTGRGCTATVHFGLILGVGWFSLVEDNSVTEVYLFPFTVVKIKTLYD